MILMKLNGFTLIELLVVISIISLLSSVVFASLNDARKKAQDAKIAELMNSIQINAELYLLDFGTYRRPNNITANNGAFSGRCTDDYLNNTNRRSIFRPHDNFLIDDPDNILFVKTTNAIREMVGISGANNGDTLCRVDSYENNRYLIAAKLQTKNGFWCIDYTQQSKKIDTLPEDGIYVCD